MVIKKNENKEREEIVLRKAEFYYTMNLKCHIRLKPTGFLNGKIVSLLVKEGAYFLFEDIRRPGPPTRIFLDEIFDIRDYEEAVW